MNKFTKTIITSVILIAFAVTRHFPLEKLSNISHSLVGVAFTVSLAIYTAVQLNELKNKKLNLDSLNYWCALIVALFLTFNWELTLKFHSGF